MTGMNKLTLGLAALMASAAMILTAGCAVEPAPTTRTLETKQGRVVGGDPTSSFPAVGALVDQGAAFCTGTLATSTTVVTAAHCIAGQTEPNGMQFFVGSDVNGKGTMIPVASIHAHPGYDDQSGDNDIAVLKLAQAAPVTPIPLRKEAMGQDLVGKEAVFVGFGVTKATKDDAGKKRMVSIPVTEIYETSFRYEASGKQTCFGDSGGPALLKVGSTYTLIGVTSYGDEDCAVYGVNTRVDTYLAFLEPLLGDGQAVAPAPAPSEPSDPPAAGEPAPSEDDICAANGWYGDGICDIGCPKADEADCEGFEDDGGWGDDLPGAPDEDFCAANGWYNDGICDIGCFEPDPDCEGGASEPSDVEPGGDDEPWDDGASGDEDLCAANGWYGDGICDEGCAQPDADCSY